MLVGVIDEASQQPRFESGVALVLGDEGWEPFMPPEDSAHYGAFRRQRLWSFGRDYAEQQELLNKLHEQRETDIHAATFMVQEERGTGALWSFGIWSEDVDTLLPRTESVVFARGHERNPEVLGVAQWERVAEIAGDLMEPTDYYPERWRVRQFPTQEQLDALALEMGPFA